MVMDRKIIAYKRISGLGNTFDKKMLEALKEGFVPFGGISISCCKDGDFLFIGQAMVKYE
jgi:hypothetical protein